MLEVYQELFMHHVKQMQSFSILKYCELSEPRKSQPSCVPDWSQMKLTNSLQLVQTSSKPDIEFVVIGSWYSASDRENHLHCRACLPQQYCTRIYTGDGLSRAQKSLSLCHTYRTWVLS